MKKTHKIKTPSLLVLLVSVFLLSVLAGVGKVSAASMWSKTYGGADAEGLFYPVVIQTSDGGFLLTGDTQSYGAGGTDAYLVKTDANGDMQWNRTYGGPLNETACGIWPTSDGGYAAMCTTSSYGAGGNDFWLIKIEADGKADWAKTYGGTADDTAYDLRQTADGGYALLGYTRSFGAGGQDVWLVKTDASGNMQWNKTYGGTGDDQGGTLILTADGGYAIPSYSTTGGLHSWLIKVDQFGNMEWNQTYRVGAASFAYIGVPTTDGGYALTGTVFSGVFGKRDAWLIKTDSSGNMLWNRTYGGAGDDTGRGVWQTADGGYVIDCDTSSFGAGGVDIWLIRTDSSGNMLWNRTYGGAGTEVPVAIILTADGGYAIVGRTNSFGAGSYDLWLIKTDELGVIPEGLTIGVMLLLSTVAFVVGTRYFRKRPK
jgi:predicted secreted protein